MDKEINRFITSWKEEKNRDKNLSFLRHVSNAHEGILRSRFLSQPRPKPLCPELKFISVYTFNKGLQACEQDKQNRSTQQNVEPETLLFYFCTKTEKHV